MKRLIPKTLVFYLVIFAIFICTLFIYQFFIQLNRANYFDSKESISKMNNINLKLDNFIKTKHKFTNFDIVVRQIVLFNQTLQKAKKSIKKGNFDTSLINQLDDLQVMFNEKKDYIERFKSTQILTLNSVHFLFELSDDLVKKNLDKEVIDLLHKTLFMIVRNLLKMEGNHFILEKNLNKIKKINSKTDEEQINFFILHCENILKNKIYLNKIINIIKTYKIEEKLEQIESLISKEFETKILQQNIINFVFFLSLLAILYLIYKEQKKIQIIKNELEAFKHAVENSDNSVVITDKNRKIVYINDSFEKVTKYQKGDIIGLEPSALQSGRTPQKTYDEMNKRLIAGEKWEGEFINKKKDGTYYYEKASIIPIFINNKLTNYLAIKLDITKYIEQKEELELSSIVFENMQEGIIICDKDKKILTTNKAFEEITGYSKEKLIGKIPNIFSNDYKDSIINQLKEKGHFRGKVIDINKNEQKFFILTNISTIKNENDEIVKYIIVYTNINDLIQSQKKAEYLAYHDKLTGLCNRIKLKTNLIEKINKVEKINGTFSLLFIDLDRFKIVNDTLGHWVGDEMLKVVSSRMNSILSSSDVLARFGGDEFVVILDENRNKIEVERICLDILDAISKTITIQAYPLNTTASIGVVSYPKDGANYTSLIKNADIAMYHAKKCGKNTFKYYNQELSLSVKEHLVIEQALDYAILKEEFYLNYQAQYDLKSKEIVSFEALVRWNSQKLGFIPPNKFIPIAEDTKKIIQIGKMIFDMACRDFVKFRKANPSLTHISINVSSIQFSDENFIDDICKILDKYNLLASQIELEVTERYVMEYSQKNLELITKLRDIGFRFAIDDFGTGYSSMSYLTKFPVDIIKIDKSFIDGIPKDNNNTQISKAIVVLAESLNCDVIAEGIELIEQEEYLSSIDCSFGQGYLFSKPLIFDDTMTLLNKS